jgi:hypothetical protein
MTTSILVTGGTGTLGQRPAATPHEPIAKGAAVTAGRHYCLPEFTVGASCVS